MTTKPSGGPRRPIRTFTFLFHAGCLGVMLSVVAVSVGGCPTLLSGLSGGNPALDGFVAAMQKLPARTTNALSVLPGGAGPSGAQFGILLEDGSQAFVLGDTDSSGQGYFSGIVWYDTDLNFLLQQDFRNGGTTLWIPSGDAIDLDVSTSTPRITLSLNGTSPRSRIVFDVQPDGTLVTNPSATTVQTNANPDYSGEAARRKLPDSSSREKMSVAGKSSYDCRTVNRTVVWAFQLVCDLKTQITAGMPIKAIEAVCLGGTAAIDTLGATSVASDTTTQRVLGGLKASVIALCEVGKAAVGVGNVITKFNPVDAACILLSLAESGRQMATGQSLAEQLCTMFTSDQVLRGVATDDYLLRLVLLDYGSEDGDQVAIRLNGQEMFRGTVRTAPQSVPINLDPGYNHFEFEALNEGTSPPNTARVIIESLSGTNLGLSSYDLTKGQIATLDITRTSGFYR